MATTYTDVLDGTQHQAQTEDAAQVSMTKIVEQQCRLRDDFIQSRGLWDDFCKWVQSRAA